MCIRDSHYTPKHGSWLDIAEIELNVMTRQCLSRRIDDINHLRSCLLYTSQQEKEMKRRAAATRAAAPAPNRFNNFEGRSYDISSVSYTHLDVYKRQL